MKLGQDMHIVLERADAKLEPAAPSSLGSAANLVAIEKHTSLMDRWRADRTASRQAGHSLAELKTACVLAEQRIANTALKIAEVQIKTALVISAMTRIGALATDLNQKTAAVDQRLTTGSHAELIAHLENRAASVDCFKALEQDCRMSSEEAATMAVFAQADLVYDINGSRERMRAAKEAVAALHGFALEGIARAKDGVA